MARRAIQSRSILFETPCILVFLQLLNKINAMMQSDSAVKLIRIFLTKNNFFILFRGMLISCAV